jgi:protein SCO1/2
MWRCFRFDTGCGLCIPPEMHNTSPRAFTLSAAMAICMATLSACGPAQNTGVAAACGARTSDTVGGPVSLVSNTGARVTEADFKGRMSLVFFGFTYCPDVCPTELYKAGAAIAQLPEGKDAPRTILITVDPERDTPDVLSRYIASNGFPKDIVGLTGTEAELRKVAEGFAAHFQKEEGDSAAGYLVSHTSILYLMDENWKLASYFTPDQSAGDIAACVASLS